VGLKRRKIGDVTGLIVCRLRGTRFEMSRSRLYNVYIARLR
jgi:hypothetical protein